MGWVQLKRSGMGVWVDWPNGFFWPIDGPSSKAELVASNRLCWNKILLTSGLVIWCPTSQCWKASRQSPTAPFFVDVFGSVLDSYLFKVLEGTSKDVYPNWVMGVHLDPFASFCNLSWIHSNAKMCLNISNTFLAGLRQLRACGLARGRRTDENCAADGPLCFALRWSRFTSEAAGRCQVVRCRFTLNDREEG